MKKFGLISALAVIFLTNVFVFAGVYYNRSGEPDAELNLTERELPLARQEEENTGMFFSLEWKMPGFQAPGFYNSEPAWLGKDILTQIGFRTDHPLQGADSHSYYHHQLPRPAWIVLEYDGPAWKQWESDANDYVKEKIKKLNDEQDENKRKAGQRQIDQVRHQLIAHTRLFAIDAGPDPQQLRQKYPNRHQHLISEGIVRINVSYYRKTDSPEKKGKAYLNGYITEIMIHSIHVPNSFRNFFQEHAPKRHYSVYYLPKDKSPQDLKPRYTVTLKYGKKYQPWITDIKPLR